MNISMVPLSRRMIGWGGSTLHNPGKLHHQSLNQGNIHTYKHTSSYVYVYIYSIYTYVRKLKHTHIDACVCIYICIHNMYVQRTCKYNHVHVSTNTVDTHLLYNLKSMIPKLRKLCCSLPALILDSIWRIWSMVGTELHWRFQLCVFALCLSTSINLYHNTRRNVHRRLAPTLEKWQGWNDSSELLVEQRETCSNIDKLPFSMCVYIYIHHFILMNDGFA